MLRGRFCQIWQLVALRWVHRQRVGLSAVNAHSWSPHSFVVALPRRSVSTTSPVLSGSSHFHNIKNIKASKDAEKSKLFNRLIKKLSLACRDGGGQDPERNSMLAKTLEECRAVGMTKETIKRALERADKALVEESFITEVQGPFGALFLLQIVSPVPKKKFNLALARSLLKQGLSQFSVVEGAVRNFFEEKGVVLVAKEESSERQHLPLTELAAAEELAITFDAEEVSDVFDETDEPVFQFTCDPKLTDVLKMKLSDAGHLVKTAQVEFQPLQPVQISEEQMNNIKQFFEKMEEDGSVEKIFDNLNL